MFRLLSSVALGLFHVAKLERVELLKEWISLFCFRKKPTLVGIIPNYYSTLNL